jgi:predicted AAA+ superfamily ATPase
MYLNRNIDKYLLDWKNSDRRKVILLRGARQVGKSSSVRELSKQFDNFIEVNIEKDDREKNIKAVFERGLDVKRICNELSAIYNQPIISGKTLLFIDEIQDCLSAIESLRYFYEDMPDLHVIAAGSLLEFAMQNIPTYGVGRIRSLFMYPFSFKEFLNVSEEKILLEHLANASPKDPLPEPLHLKLKKQLIAFMLIGGMPEVVSSFLNTNSFLECQNILEDITQSFYIDFAKYKEKVNIMLLKEVFSSVIEQTGSKFVYSGASNTANHQQIKECISLLEMAGLIYPVTHTSANGLPLSAEENIKFRKYHIFDTGIYQRFLKLETGKILDPDSLVQINKGAFADLFAGLEMLKNHPANIKHSLHYWHREEKRTNAEVDYVVQIENKVIPVEVKANTKGSMQSMFQFISEKNSPYGIRCSMENFAAFKNIQVFPLYAVANMFDFERIV